MKVISQWLIFLSSSHVLLCSHDCKEADYLGTELPEVLAEQGSGRKTSKNDQALRCGPCQPLQPHLPSAWHLLCHSRCPKGPVGLLPPLPHNTIILSPTSWPLLILISLPWIPSSYSPTLPPTPNSCVHLMTQFRCHLFWGAFLYSSKAGRCTSIWCCHVSPGHHISTFHYAVSSSRIKVVTYSPLCHHINGSLGKERRDGERGFP